MLSSLLGGLGHLQALQFTGMGGPMGVYENYDTYCPRPPASPCHEPTGSWMRQTARQAALAGRPPDTDARRRHATENHAATIELRTV